MALNVVLMLQCPAVFHLLILTCRIVIFHGLDNFDISLRAVNSGEESEETLTMS